MHEREDFFLGLDLGKVKDFSCLVALARRPVPDPRRPERHVWGYTVRGLKRWPLDTLYTTVVDEVVKLVSEGPLAGCTLGVDYTGCGMPVVEMLRLAKPRAKVTPVYITTGAAVTPDGGGYRASKTVLVSTVQLLLQDRRLTVPETIPERQTLESELLAFRARITAHNNESFEADWRLRAHDDAVLGLAIAAFLGERESALADALPLSLLPDAPRGVDPGMWSARMMQRGPGGFDPWPR